MAVAKRQRKGKAPEEGIKEKPTSHLKSETLG